MKGLEELTKKLAFLTHQVDAGADVEMNGVTAAAAPVNGHGPPTWGPVPTNGANGMSPAAVAGGWADGSPGGWGPAQSGWSL